MTDQNANAERIVACVNAMQGIRNPGGVRGLVEAARAVHSSIDAIRHDLGTQYPELSESWVRLGAAIAALDAEESR